MAMVKEICGAGTASVVVVRRRRVEKRVGVNICILGAVLWEG